MINTTDILTNWQRIGWLEPSKTGYTAILDTDNKTSLSGKTFDSLHPMTNFVKVKDTYPDIAASAAVLNAQLKAWQQTGIVDAMTKVFNKDDIIENGVLLNNVIDFSDTVENSGKFVFIRVIVPFGFVFNVKSVGVSLDGVKNFNFYVFNSSKLASLVSNKSTINVANTETWTAWDYSCWGKSTSLKSGIYYIGYFQSDLGTVKAIQREFYKENCICGIDYCIAIPNGTSLPHEDDVIYSGYTHGINLDYSISRDFSHYFIDNPGIFDNAIGLYVQIQCLRQIMLSDRMNVSQRSSEDVLNYASQIFVEINGSQTEEMRSKGLFQLYKEEIESIRSIINKKNNLTITVR